MTTKAKPAPEEILFVDPFGNPETYADKAKLAAERASFKILSIEYSPSGGFEGEARWEVKIDLNGDESLITLGSNEKRDQTMRAAKWGLENGKMSGFYHLQKSGNAYYIAKSRGADEQELAF
jgi:hypothetical protein